MAYGMLGGKASDMSLRFTRRLSIVPGLRVDLSKRGASLSGSHRGARYKVGPRGGRATLGLLGTGLFGWRRSSHSARAMALPAVLSPR